MMTHLKIEQNSNNTETLSDLSSDIRTELGIIEADIDRVPNNS